MINNIKNNQNRKTMLTYVLLLEFSTLVLSLDIHQESSPILDGDWKKNEQNRDLEEMLDSNEMPLGFTDVEKKADVAVDDDDLGGGNKNMKSDRPDGRAEEHARILQEVFDFNNSKSQLLIYHHSVSQGST